MPRCPKPARRFKLMNPSVVILTLFVSLLIASTIPIVSGQIDPGGHEIAVSTSPDRGGALPLDGAVVSGNMFAFVRPETGITRVLFYVDDPAQSGNPFKVENYAPWDLGGTLPAPPLDAHPVDTSEFLDGLHTLTAVLEHGNGEQSALEATFTIDNELPALAFGQTHLSFVVGEDDSAAMDVDLFTTDGSPASFLLLSDAPWLIPQPDAGTTPATLTIAVDSTGLVPQVHDASIVAAADGYEPAVLFVELTVDSTEATLLVSTVPDRSNASALAGYVATDDIHVFVSPDTDIDRVTFYLDDATSPIQIENFAPFDFVGTASNGNALSFDTATLIEGSHPITAQIEYHNGSQETIGAVFQAGNAAPWLETDVPSLAFSLDEGQLDTADLIVSASDGSETDFTISENATWLSVSPQQGATPDVLTVAVDSTGLSATVYQTSIDISAIGYLPVRVTATLSVGTDGDYRLWISTTADRSIPVPLSDSAVADEVYVFTMPDEDVTRVSYYLDDASFAGAPRQVENFPPFDFAGTTSNGNAAPFDTTTITDGVHTVSALLETAGGQVILHENLTVTNDVRSLNLDRHALFFDAASREQPPNQTVAVSTSDGAGAGFDVSYVEAWLSVTPVAGTAPLSLTVTVDVSELPDGYHTADVLITAGGYSSVTLAVSVTVGSIAEPIRGGRLYDKWWVVNGASEPMSNHPLYPPDGQKSGSTTWRCKECHGWDYKGAAGAYGPGSSHFTGIPGVFGSTLSATEMFDTIKNPNGDGTGGTTVNGHDFGNVGLADDDVTDLVDFLQTLLIDTDEFVDGDGAFIGDEVQGETNYTGAESCIFCHGTGGTAINFGTPQAPEWVGTVAVNNPWELMHKIRLGQPGSTPQMPSWTADGGSDQGAADIGLYAQLNFPSAPGPGEPIRGGQLYDKWWAVNGASEPVGDHPLYPPEGQKSGSTTWRCKECHGWDYKGPDGAYGPGSSHFTGIPGVFGSTLSASEMFDIIKNPNGDGTGGTTVNGHDFGNFDLADGDINDLVDFLQTLLIDTDDFIDGGGAFIGDELQGEANYLDVGGCIACHGPNGTGINFGSPQDPEWVGTVAVNNPWELMHKIRLGQPGSIPLMPSWTEYGGSDQGVADIGLYAQLNFPSAPGPGEPIRGGQLYDKWWAVNGASEPVGDHPLYPPEGQKSGSTTWRCKECHGWDYKGPDGAYGPGSSHFTGIPGVFGSTLSASEMFDIIKNPNGDGTGGTTVNGHDFGNLDLADGDINDLVEFLQTLLIDTDDFIDGGGAFSGDEVQGEANYLDVGGCIDCHGPDGTGINFGSPQDPEWVGTVAVNNPWELMHKIRLGQPGSIPLMPSWTEYGGSDQGVADIGLYAQLNFPTEPDLIVCSPPPCAQPVVTLPYMLSFDDDHGRIPGGTGVGTGLTMIAEPSQGTGYISENLAVDTGRGVLEIMTTSGLAFGSSNSQDNMLGVGLNTTADPFMLSTTLLDLPAANGQFEQAGLWFGQDEDHHAKLDVISKPEGLKIEFVLEVGGQVVDQEQVDVDATAAAVTVVLSVNPAAGYMTAGYVVGDESRIFVSSNAPVSVVGTAVGYGGLFASHRNAAASLTYTFDDFAVEAGMFESTGPRDIAFNRMSHTLPFPTAMIWGPDDRLYVTELLGTVHALTFGPDKSVVDDEIITALKDVHGQRLTLGITVDPDATAENVTLWIAHSSPALNDGIPNSSMVSRLSGPGFATVDDIITGLPRSVANHSINGIHFGPDGQLYIAQGGNTGAGAPNEAPSEFGTMEEQPLSAALLVADVKDPSFVGDCDHPTDIFAAPPCDVAPYATGLRNMYDFTFHSNGYIYAPDNGLGVTGTYPATPTAPCFGYADAASWTQGGHDPGAQPDILLRLEEGKYYGHPNPHRGECIFQDGSYQGVAPAANYVPPIFVLGDHTSSNGTIEYLSSTFCGALRGELLIANYSVGDNIVRLRLSDDGSTVINSEVLADGFRDPLPLAQAPDGTIFVGEFGGNRITALAPRTHAQWSSHPSAPLATLDAGSATLDGLLYTVAGKTSSGPMSSMFIYDPAQDTWMTGPDLPGPAVENPAVAAGNGRLYACGGSTAPFSGALSSAAVYDPVSNAWAALPPMPTARGGAAAVYWQGLLFVIGGMDASGASVATVEVFDPQSGSWSTAAPLGIPRDNPGAAVVNDALYVFGGRWRLSNGTAIDSTLQDVEAYDIITNTWHPRSPMLTGRRTFAVGTMGGRVQIVGGEGTPETMTAFAENEEYDPITDTWFRLPSMMTPRHGMAFGTIDGQFYTIGGGLQGGSSFSAVVESYRCTTQP